MADDKPTGGTATMNVAGKELRGVPTAAPRTAPGAPTKVATRPSGSTSIMSVGGQKDFRGVPAAPVRTAPGTISSRKSLTELGQFVESQVSAYKMAVEAAAREARTATALAATRDEVITELRVRVSERERQLAAVTAERDMARAESETLSRQLRTVTEMAMTSTNPNDVHNRKRWFGRS